MLMTLSKNSSPSMALCFPARFLARFRSAESFLYKISLTREDFPEPDTPVTQVKVPSGIDTSTSRRLFSAAPRMVSTPPLPFLLSLGTGMLIRPER